MDSPTRSNSDLHRSNDWQVRDVWIPCMHVRNKHHLAVLELASHTTLSPCHARAPWQSKSFLKYSISDGSYSQGGSRTCMVVGNFHIGIVLTEVAVDCSRNSLTLVPAPQPAVIHQRLNQMFIQDAG